MEKRWSKEGELFSGDPEALLKELARLKQALDEAHTEIARVQSARFRETEEFMRVKLDLEAQIAELKDHRDERETQP